MICTTCVWYDRQERHCTLLDISEIDETDETATDCEAYKPANPENN